MTEMRALDKEFPAPEREVALDVEWKLCLK